MFGYKCVREDEAANLSDNSIIEPRSLNVMINISSWLYASECFRFDQKPTCTSSFCNPLLKYLLSQVYAIGFLNPEFSLRKSIANRVADITHIYNRQHRQ